MTRIALLFLLLPALAFPAAVVFSNGGTEVKALKPILDLNGQSKILSGATDPTSVAVNAPIGSLYLNSTNNKLYKKTDSGLSTSWLEMLSSASASTLQTQAFTSSGTFNVPLSVSRVIVCGRGGGGGGGGGEYRSGGTGTERSGSGGGGAATVCLPVSVTAGGSVVVTIGAGGAGGTALGADGTGNNGSDGGDTTFGALATFKGAKGGYGGGKVSDTNLLNIVAFTSRGWGVGGGGHGGIGGGAGGFSNSLDGQGSHFASGGTSGGSPAGGGGGAQGASGGNGTDGGGGGGGTYRSGGGATSAGGNGGDGKLTVIWSAP
jgi:hypothetical protein